VAVWRDREALSQRASQFSPRVTSDVPALNLLKLPSAKSLHLSTCLSISFGGADVASSSPSYREPPSSSRFRPTSLTSNHFKLVALHEVFRTNYVQIALLRERVSPLSRSQTRARSPSLSIDFTPPRSTSSALGGHTESLKSSAVEPSSQPVNPMVIRLS
jgi:hypothetical protein